MLHAAPIQQRLALRNGTCIAGRRVAARAVATAPADLSPGLERLPSKAELDSRYTLTELLGEGTYSTVYAGIDKVTGEDVAIKYLPKYKHLKSRYQELLTEIDMRKQLRHCRNAIELYGIFEDSQGFYFVEELCSGGDVQGLLAAEGTLTESEAAQVLKSMLLFLADSHAHKIAIGDIKPANFAVKNLYPSIQHMMDPSKPKGRLELRMIDFGCCQKFDEQCLLPKFTGTPVYMAPEVLLGCPGLEMDIWASGVVLYELLCGKFPFWDCEPIELDNMTHTQLKDGIINGGVLFNDPIWQGTSSSAKDLIMRMLDRNVSTRITAREALQHPFIKQAANAFA